ALPLPRHVSAASALERDQSRFVSSGGPRLLGIAYGFPKLGTAATSGEDRLRAPKLSLVGCDLYVPAASGAAPSAEAQGRSAEQVFPRLACPHSSTLGVAPLLLQLQLRPLLELRQYRQYPGARPKTYPGQPEHEFSSRKALGPADNNGLRSGGD